MHLITRSSNFHFVFFPLLLLPFFLIACKEKKSQSTEIIRSVKTIVITKASTTGNRQLSGVVKPSDESDLSFQVGGTVDNVAVKLGDSVKKGQLLSSIDPRDFELNLHAAKAALASAKAVVATTLEDYKRQQTLQVGNVSSKAILEKSRAQYESAVGKEKIENSNVEITNRNLERTKLLAPFDGKISQRSIDPHQETQAGRVIFKLQSEEGLKVEVLVPESMIRTIKQKQSVKVDFPTLKSTQVLGTVREIGAQSNIGNAFPVTINLSQTTADLRAGMSAQVIFDWRPTDTETVYLIPLSAIDTRPHATQNLSDQTETAEKKVSVFLFDTDESKVKRQEVTVRGIQGNLIETTKGIKDGDILVTAGVPFLEEGQTVTQWKQKYRNPETDR